MYIYPQGKAKKPKAAVTLEMEAATNPTLEGSLSDPTLFCTAYKKNRFYMFTKLVIFRVSQIFLKQVVIHYR